MHQFYYFDAQCTRPKYGITAEGSIKVQQMSWVVRGGAESVYRLYNVTINPYNKHFARKLSKRIKMYCKSLHGITVKRYRKYKIFNFPRKFQKSKDFDCTGLLSLSFHELQLLKVELKKTTNFNKHNSYLNDNKISRYEKPTRLLYLGNIHTDIKQRSTYRPYSYQTPLKKGNVSKIFLWYIVININFSTLSLSIISQHRPNGFQTMFIIKNFSYIHINKHQVHLTWIYIMTGNAAAQDYSKCSLKHHKRYHFMLRKPAGRTKFSVWKIIEHEEPNVMSCLVLFLKYDFFLLKS